MSTKSTIARSSKEKDGYYLNFYHEFHDGFNHLVGENFDIIIPDLYYTPLLKDFFNNNLQPIVRKCQFNNSLIEECFIKENILIIDLGNNAMMEIPLK